MEKLTIGKLAEKDAQRDAIHIAIAPVTAGKILSPGEHVGLIGRNPDVAGPCDKLIGIVDPYLKQAVLKGEQFYLFLYPNTVTSLRHQWTHPAFESLEAIASSTVTISHKDAAKAWLTTQADRIDGLSFEELMDAARHFVSTGDYFVQGGRFEGMYVDDDFWKWYEIYTDTKVPETRKHSFFSCSC
jgi:hypothetical protein